MIPAPYRLTRKRDFDILYKEGRFVNGEYVTLKFWRISPEKYPRRGYATTDLKVGFVVSTKVSKSAVKRNRAKRQMREVMRLIFKETDAKKGYLVAVIAKPKILDAVYGDIARDIRSVLSRAGLV